jgi:isoleucyl-tRNA synthetase
MIDYKSTVLLPQTDFPMRGRLPETEPAQVERWRSGGVYQKMLQKNAGRPKFVLPDGPPYANGDIHVGHALNKVLKDAVIKYKNMRGFSAAFIPGWDCHGLPIELKVGKELGEKRKSMTDKDFRQACRAEATKWIHLQAAQFQRLGVLADWDNFYSTMQPGYEADEIRVLAKIHDNGLLYRGEKPVYWCPALQTALAAAEIEYRDHKSPAIYVRFETRDPRVIGLAAGHPKPVSFVIWTTTPWTLPANLGIALNADFEYGFYETDTGVLILATEMAGRFASDTGVALSEPLARVKGKDLDRATARHPFIDRDSLVLMGSHVTLDAGTGVVHTAPGHGLEDYQVGVAYGLPVLSPVGKDGRFASDVARYGGLKIWDANPAIVEDLRKSGHLLGHKDLVHSYPHNPRTRTPVIFRATPQWFIRMDGEHFGLRNRARLATEKEIDFVPQWGAARLQAMIDNTPDWCLSRQRVWGVPIPVFYCKKCEEPLVQSSIMNRVAEKMESTGAGLEAYFDTEPAAFTKGVVCGRCSGVEFERGQDILDVWFDSGVCHTAVQKRRPELAFPADIYLEGSDQHRGWFQTSLMSSLASDRTPPYRALITHGFVNDAQGEKMSKSKGNVISPADVVKKHGAEILRLWVAYEDYGQDVTVGEEMFLRITETYRRIRNTFRFLLGNLQDFDPNSDRVAVEAMPILDRWALAELNALIEKVTGEYDRYNFYRVYHLINQFFTVTLSATYLDVLKDRLYTSRKDGVRRRASQTVFHELLLNLCGLMAPVTTFIAEETFAYIPGPKPESVLLADFPTTRDAWRMETPASWQQAMGLRDTAAKKLEDLRVAKEIGSSLDAELVIEAPGAVYDHLNTHAAELRELFIVSRVHLQKVATELKVTARKAAGDKCPRCWHYSTELNTNSQFPGACPKCVSALK